VIKGLPNPGCQFFSLARGDMMPLGWIALGVARLPTDPVGTFTLRLKNIVRGSRYRIEVATTGALADTDGEGDAPAGTGTTTDVDITLPYYASGNANNDLRIKVRKGSAATKYLPFETQAVAQAGVVISYISQTADSIA
jgi:hypothetical protein